VPPRSSTPTRAASAEEFTAVLETKGVRIGMDGKRRWIDNVFIERLWRSVKYEDIYLHAYQTPREVKVALARLLRFLQCAPAIRASNIEHPMRCTSERKT